MSTDYMQVKIVKKKLDTVSSHYVLPSEYDVVKCEDGLTRGCANSGRLDSISSARLLQLSVLYISHAPNSDSQNSPTFCALSTQPVSYHPSGACAISGGCRIPGKPACPCQHYDNAV